MLFLSGDFGMIIDVFHHLTGNLTGRLSGECVPKYLFTQTNIYSFINVLTVVKMHLVSASIHISTLLFPKAATVPSFLQTRGMLSLKSIHCKR